MIKEDFDWTTWVQHGKLSRARGLIQAICEFSKDQDTARVAAEVGHLLDEFNEWFIQRELPKTKDVEKVDLKICQSCRADNEVLIFSERYKLNLCGACLRRLDESEK